METELDRIHKVNILALSTYALALAGSSKSSTANKKLLQSMIFNKGENFIPLSHFNQVIRVWMFPWSGEISLGRKTNKRTAKSKKKERKPFVF